MDPPYLYVDAIYAEETEYRGICVKIGDNIVNREFSGDIEEDARKTGEFLCVRGYTEWLNSSSIDNYLYNIAFDAGLEEPDVDLRELIQEGYSAVASEFTP
jgi:hypothetical protein